MKPEITIEEQQIFLAGRWVSGPQKLAVRNPYDGATVAETSLASDEDLERATEASLAIAPTLAALPTYERAAILYRVSQYLSRHRDDIARTLAREAGKPIRDALVETDRASMTFHVASDEARRLGGEVIPLDLAPHGVGRVALTRRFPIGPIAAISPFNFPLNLSAHKIAPAIAAGNPIVLKPATKTPLSALALARAAHDAGLPAGALSVLPMARETGDRLVTDERFKLLTFTGSSAVGWQMKPRVGKKKVILELGGNAGVIVDETAHLPYAVKRVVTGGFAFAGQSCISVQRVYVHRRVFDEFSERLVSSVRALKLGDPLDPATDVGPMIEPSEVARIEEWVNAARQEGANVLTGGKRFSNTIFEPTVLINVPDSSRICTQEVFAPLVTLSGFDDFSDALAAVNRSSYGLQAGVFTSELERMLTAFDQIQVGGVIINDVPTYRIDHMPYGGVKDSGFGREGPRYAIEEMTELKLLVINRQLS